MKSPQNKLSPKIDEQIITELLSEVSPQELFSKGGVMDQLKKQLVERVLKGIKYAFK
ncbi:MAG: hypothetical protein AAF673_02500 [Pseudomonadota bacterium]